MAKHIMIKMYYNHTQSEACKICIYDTNEGNCPKNSSNDLICATADKKGIASNKISHYFIRSLSGILNKL